MLKSAWGGHYEDRKVMTQGKTTRWEKGVGFCGLTRCCHKVFDNTFYYIGNIWQYLPHKTNIFNSNVIKLDNTTMLQLLEYDYDYDYDVIIVWWHDFVGGNFQTFKEQ